MEMPENLPSSIWAIAWAKTYQVFSEQMNQEAVDIMQSVFDSVVLDAQEEMKAGSGVDKVLEIQAEARKKERERIIRIIEGRNVAQPTQTMLTLALIAQALKEEGNA